MQSVFHEKGPIAMAEAEKVLADWLRAYPQELNKVLIIPPDGTRAHSLAGPVTNLLYRLLQPAEVKILPALGTHFPMTDEEKRALFGEEIPLGCYLDHNWRTDVQSIGTIPAEFVAEVSDGLLSFPIAVDINREILNGGYDLIISVGQVVPHEVVGMANYTKNIVVGCGGKDIIDKSHYLGAVYGMEQMMGRDHSPVRKVFDYAQENLLADLPITYILTVTETKGPETALQGLFIGSDREVFTRAVASSQRHNLDLLERPLKKVVVYLDPDEFRSTWLGNKAVYRTRMAIADGGELLILAPGVRSFGEDPGIDALIRAYGYKNRDEILDLAAAKQDLKDSLSVAAHLIHGSSDGRFKITYAVQHLSAEEITGVNYNYMAYAEAVKLYDPHELQDGWNQVNGEEIFFVSNPALGLWALQKDFAN